MFEKRLTYQRTVQTRVTTYAMEAIPVITSGLFAGRSASASSYNASWIRKEFSDCWSWGCASNPGFALSVSAAEHPARKAIDPQEANKQFTISYKRAAYVQARLSTLSCQPLYSKCHHLPLHIWSILCHAPSMQCVSC